MKYDRTHEGGMKSDQDPEQLHQFFQPAVKSSKIVFY